MKYLPPLLLLGAFPAALGGGAALVLYQLNLLSTRKALAVGIFVSCWIFIKGVLAIRQLYGPDAGDVISPSNYCSRMGRAYLIVPVALVCAYLVCRILHFETHWPAILVLLLAIQVAHLQWSL